MTEHNIIHSTMQQPSGDGTITVSYYQHDDRFIHHSVDGKPSLEEIKNDGTVVVREYMKDGKYHHDQDVPSQYVKLDDSETIVYFKNGTMIREHSPAKIVKNHYGISYTFRSNASINDHNQLDHMLLETSGELNSYSRTCGYVIVETTFDYETNVIEYFVRHINKSNKVNITSWLEKKEWTLPFTDEMIYEMALKFL